MPDDLTDCYRVLEIPPDADSDTIKRAWRDLTKVWHPDRFRGDPQLERKAEEKLKAINEAYRRLTEISSTTGVAGSAVSASQPTPAPPPQETSRPHRSAYIAVGCALFAGIVLLVLVAGGLLVHSPPQAPPVQASPEPKVDVSRLSWQYSMVPNIDPFNKDAPPRFRARVHNQTTCWVKAVTVSFADDWGERRRYRLWCNLPAGIGPESVGDCEAEVLRPPVSTQQPVLISGEADFCSTAN